MDKQNNLYANYLSNYFGTIGDFNRVRMRKLAMLRKNYSMLLPVSHNVRILEIGPGHGELLELLKLEGYNNVQAIDLSTEVAEQCNRLWSGSTIVVEDPIEFLEQHQDTFDMVFLLHVLEHVPKPQIIPLLQAIRAALAQEGKLVVEVPNMANPISGLYTRYVDFTHEIGFVDASLAFVLKQAGFGKVSIHELKLPLDRWYRPLQIIFSRILKLIFELLQFSLALRSSRLIAHSIFAYAVK